MVRTAGAGGRELTKTIQVRTDDPDNQKFYLRISGKVKEIVKISPGIVSLSGVPGQTLSQVVTIEPVQGDELKVRGMRLKYNRQIKAELIKPGRGEKHWQVKISCYCNHSADLYDFITLTTDNPRKPQLTIRVYATFEHVAPVETHGSKIGENNG